MLIEPDVKTAITLITQRGAVKRMVTQEMPVLSRAKRGLMMIRELKSHPHRLVFMGLSHSAQFEVITQNNTRYLVGEMDFPLSDRTSNGSFLGDEKKDGEVFEVKTELSVILEQD